MERIKRYPNRKCNIQHDRIGMQAEEFKALLKLQSKEVLIFEYPKYSEVIYNSQPQKELRFFSIL
jgi:hypothetical protein